MNFGSLAVEPTGRFLYLQNGNQGGVYGFALDQATGALTALPGSPYLTANGNALTVDASGRFVYVAKPSTPTGVITLAINQSTGALTAVTGSPVAGTFPQALTATAAGVVSSATLVSVQLVPDPVSVVTSQLNVRRQLTLVGTYSDGTTRFLTESASWSSSAASVASISNTAGSKGLLTANAYGTATLTATVNGLTDTTLVTVAQPAVTTITLTPASPTIANGTAIQLQATATFADGSTQPATSLATWIAADPAIATVGDTAATKGLVTAVAPGSTTVSASYNGVSGTASVTVTAVSGAGAPRFVYGPSGNALSGYIIDQATGALAPVPGGAVSESGGQFAVQRAERRGRSLHLQRQRPGHLRLHQQRRHRATHLCDPEWQQRILQWLRGHRAQFCECHLSRVGPAPQRPVRVCGAGQLPRSASTRIRSMARTAG